MCLCVRMGGLLAASGRQRVGHCATAHVFPMSAVATPGAGLHQVKHNVVVTRAGVLRHAEPNRFWVETSMRRVRDGVRARVYVRIAWCSGLTRCAPPTAVHTVCGRHSRGHGVRTTR